MDETREKRRHAAINWPSSSSGLSYNVRYSSTAHQYSTVSPHVRCLSRLSSLFGDLPSRRIRDLYSTPASSIHCRIITITTLNCRALFKARVTTVTHSRHNIRAFFSLHIRQLPSQWRRHAQRCPSRATPCSRKTARLLVRPLSLRCFEDDTQLDMNDRVTQ